MNILAVSVAALWVDFVVIYLSHIFDFGQSLKKWYANFGPVAVINDVLVIVLGILFTQFILPKASIFLLVPAVVAIQMVHDYLFNVYVIQKAPKGNNRMIDIFKEYVDENSYKILIADGIMIFSALLFSRYLQTLSTNMVSFIGLLGVYLMTYIIYTR
jgi:hypothetical protein